MKRIEGFSYPRGLSSSNDGDVLVAETGGGRVLEMSADGNHVEVVTSLLPHSLDSGPGSAYPAGPSAVSVVDDELYVIVGEFKGDRFARLYRLVGDTEYEPVTPPNDAFSAAENRFANPYDMVRAPEVDGWIVSDSGRNALLAVSDDGELSDYALFGNFVIAGREASVEVVPTGIARGPDGAIYVGSLTGFPYPQGEAVVWRIEDRNGDGDAFDADEVEPFITGLTTVTDITFAPDGTMYIAEFTMDMQAVIQGGNIIENAETHPGRVLAWDGRTLQVLTDSAITPTGLLATDRSLYISEEFNNTLMILPINQ